MGTDAVVTMRVVISAGLLARGVYVGLGEAVAVAVGSSALRLGVRCYWAAGEEVCLVGVDGVPVY